MNDSTRESNRLAREISDGPVRALFERFVLTCARLHGEVRIQATSVELVFSFRDRLVCRLAPYRELFHVQVGGNPGWETRVRSETGLLDTVERTLERFLEIYGAVPE